MSLHLFPGPNARALVDNAVRLYALGRWGRQQMMTYIADLLDDYRVTRLPVRNYMVKRSLDVVTPIGAFPVVVIEAPAGVHDRCPACGSGCWRYLGGEAPAVTAWCMSCGCIYTRGVSEDEKAG